MKRYIIIGTMAIALLSLGVISGTVAYSSAQNEVTNEIKMGKIHMTILEDFNPEEVRNLAPSPLERLRKIIKEVRIQNHGAEAYVRVKLEKKWGTQDEEGNFVEEAHLQGDNILLFLGEAVGSKGNWQVIDDAYYLYMEAAEKESVLSPLLLESFAFVDHQAVGIEGDGNAYLGKSVKIDVSAEAIQVPNGAMEAQWGITYQDGYFTKVEA